ncbi:MAG: hypothetical protein MJ055_01985 [Phascolarctobacterium sp.]|nr:hypothetical protein [Phascolarctobacterium sp.]
MMNEKAKAFETFLEERFITVFEMEEIHDDLNTCVFKSRITVEGQNLVTLVILDSSIYGMIRVVVADKALNEKNELRLRKLIDSLNSSYKMFKYYFAKDGSLVLDVCMLEKSNGTDGNMIYTVFDVIIKHLEGEYKNIMKAIWA